MADDSENDLPKATRKDKLVFIGLGLLIVLVIVLIFAGIGF